MPAKLRTRQCPVDWANLEAKKFAVFGPDVTADQCPKCGGLFFDKNEVARVTGNHEVHTYLTKMMGLDSDSKRVCPNDGMVMDAEDVDGTRVDVCLTCFGLWLDAGELYALRNVKAGLTKTLTPQKEAELAHAKAVKSKQHKDAIKMFFRRLAGLDLIKKA